MMAARPMIEVIMLMRMIKIRKILIPMLMMVTEIKRVEMEEKATTMEMMMIILTVILMRTRRGGF